MMRMMMIWRNSELIMGKHEKLDPAIFGKDESEETSSSEEDDDDESYGTDPNNY